MNLKNSILLVIGAVLLGYGIGRFTTPEKIVTVEKEVVKESREKETTKKEIKKPDGTVVTVITEKDKTKTESKKESKTNITNRPDWKAGLMYGYSFDDNKPVYGLEIDRRIIGNISLGVWANTQKAAGLVLIYEF